MTKLGYAETQLIRLGTVSTGDCQFDAIAKGCNIPGGFLQVRYDVADELENCSMPLDIRTHVQHQEERAYRGLKDLPDVELRRELARRIRVPGNSFWGDSLTLILASKRYETCFLLYTIKNRKIQSKNLIYSGNQPACRKILVLLYTQGLHYELAGFKDSFTGTVETSISINRARRLHLIP
jgi:hypothetical protein